MFGYIFKSGGVARIFKGGGRFLIEKGKAGSERLYASFSNWSPEDILFYFISFWKGISKGISGKRGGGLVAPTDSLYPDSFHRLKRSSLAWNPHCAREGKSAPILFQFQAWQKRITWYRVLSWSSGFQGAVRKHSLLHQKFKF